MPLSNYDNTTTGGALPTIKWPEGKASTVSAAELAAIITAGGTIRVANNATVINTGVLAAAMTLPNLAIASDLGDGAMLYILSESDGTARTITLGTGFLSPNITGVISKKRLSTFVLLNGSFTQISTTTLN